MDASPLQSLMTAAILRTTRPTIGLLAFLAGAPPPVSASPPTLEAHRVERHPPRIDGVLDDDAWQEQRFVSGFLQKEPNEGQPSSVQTEVAITYDDDALYVAARLESPEPEALRATITRRDNIGSNAQFIVVIDSYHDKRTAYGFALTPAGVRGDWYHPGDMEGWREWSYDPVWEGQTSITSAGWNAEMRIPYSQLRFTSGDEQVWGINFNRFIPNTNEDTYWVLIPKSETGWASRFGELRGLRSIEPPRRLELTPYYANDARLSSAAEDNPFDDGSQWATRVGADVKLGVGPNLTLEATVNPDFGQVEADPAQVNLSAFETFFEERRPFFIEGQQLLRGSGPSYYYSRRIGAPPRGDADGDFVDRPDNTTLWTAAKLTGRLENGTSIGALAAVASPEDARVFNTDTGRQERVPIEPAAGYGVVRAQRELGAAQSTLGGTLTLTQRDVTAGEPLAGEFNSSAVAGGTDWNWRFQDGKYELAGHAGFSHVRGTAEQMRRVQESSRRYFQRPDANHVTLDSTRTALSGFTASLDFEKNAGEHWLWEAGLWAESPGFEINDLGSLGSADDLDTYANLRYRHNEPGGVFRRHFVNLFVNNGWNFGGTRQFTSAGVYSESTWRNFYNTWFEFDSWARAFSDNATRGGPLMGTGAGYEIAGGLSNYWAAPVHWNARFFSSTNELGGFSWGTSGGVQVRVASRWELSLEPEFRRQVNTRQYVTSLDGGRPETYGRRSIFGTVDQTQVSLQNRFNYSFTPDLSLEFYAEPFAASGRYYDFGELRRARSRDLIAYGRDPGTTIDEVEDGNYEVSSGGETFEFSRDDFNVLSFRSNFVLRWEWSPGSTLFLVWQQDRGADDAIGRRVRGRSLWDAVRAEGSNILAFKVSYWLPIQ